RDGVDGEPNAEEDGQRPSRKTEAGGARPAGRNERPVGKAPDATRAVVREGRGEERNPGPEREPTAPGSPRFGARGQDDERDRPQEVVLIQPRCNDEEAQDRDGRRPHERHASRRDPPREDDQATEAEGRRGEEGTRADGA